jgi:hypothetical protein
LAPNGSPVCLDQPDPALVRVGDLFAVLYAAVELGEAFALIGQASQPLQHRRGIFDLGIRVRTRIWRGRR